MRKNNSSEETDYLYLALHNYIYLVSEQFKDIVSQWKKNVSRQNEFEVLGALLSRIIYLAIDLAGAPSIWTMHTAPIILRVMIDAYINLAWIFDNPEERSKLYIAYGLGQAKLHLEQIKKMEEEGKIEDINYQPLESWIDSQRYTFLTDVNIGNWSGSDIRNMAIESGCKDIYDSAFSPFSNAIHNTWYQTGRCNVELCQNPLHGYHFVPKIPKPNYDPYYFILAMKYANIALELYAEKIGAYARMLNAERFMLDFLSYDFEDF